MLNQNYIDMLGQKSVIRELFAYGSERAKEIGYEKICGTLFVRCYNASWLSYRFGGKG